jgi:hypothetical protein
MTGGFMIAELTMTGHTVIHSEGQVIWFFLYNEDPAEFDEWLDKHYDSTLTAERWLSEGADKRGQLQDHWRTKFYENLELANKKLKERK